MIHRKTESPLVTDECSFSKLMERLGENFCVRDVMLPLDRLKYVAPEADHRARVLIEENRYSVIPASRDGRCFPNVYEKPSSDDSSQSEFRGRHTEIKDCIPDSTPLAEAFYLFKDREWYLTLRGSGVSGLVTYWCLNSREFRLQLFAGLSRVEELSRDILVAAGCGVKDEHGILLSPKELSSARKRFERSQQQMGGDRFVDELQFSQVLEALNMHRPWQQFLQARLPDSLPGSYSKHRGFIELRNSVMHGKVMFSTYSSYKACFDTIEEIGRFIAHLNAYDLETKNKT